MPLTSLFPYTAVVLLELLNTPSPTGFTEAAMRVVERHLLELGIPFSRTRKGALLWTLEPQESHLHAKTLAFAAHIDTLGAMVKSIKPNGRLTLSQLGAYDWISIEGEYALVHLQNGSSLSATVVNTKQSIHVHSSDLRELKRDEHTLELRLDAVTSTLEETKALGVEVGDFVSWDSRAQLTLAGYIKGRHLDNKAAVAIFLLLTKAYTEGSLHLRHTAHFYLSSYEEVGHGSSSGIPLDTDELIVVDMAAIGEGQNSSEHHCSICLKDSGGPYDHLLSSRIRALAQATGLELRPDIYPWYASDGTAAWRAGAEYPVALIGPGVDASHAYERTHFDALEATARLMAAYLQH